ncbi:MAG: hypothetical protein Q8N10_08950 [Phenylobacterium sp.]|jgi:hypothetical protein|uniref:hypothetical protein n=1 Tax=Phenylobacterium sp. TaxID=1871053 RepID=UPI0027236760|nr:hypothetical protein [Phenylobacterium sp.]MDO8324576.1 hypothetical protein [Phenylobacterium sp.]MDO8913776.1 hypothetical protein [Phenylobacterium sp.]MDO9248657.1 hypothetical protein [Phenylobacterium sp.]MDP2008866.1 hypothetical protein [Phenylobacterium sp.]MDP3100615.1 hypothetical protein [Phenylobacterium sp.]
MRLILTLAAVSALALSAAACSDKPNATGAAMPDTDSVAGTGAATAPDAGVTGAVPADGSPPPMQATSPAAEGAGVGTSGGQGAGSGTTTP